MGIKRKKILTTTDKRKKKYLTIVRQMETKNNIQWFTESIYIDIDTGEMISKSKAYRDYIILQTHKKTKINGKIGIVTITNECKPTGQLYLF